jgi:hypothetical protein
MAGRWAVIDPNAKIDPGRMGPIEGLETKGCRSKAAAHVPVMKSFSCLATALGLLMAAGCSTDATAHRSAPSKKVMLTGSMIPVDAADVMPGTIQTTAQPVSVYDTQWLQRTGRQTLGGALSTVPQLAGRGF